MPTRTATVVKLTEFLRNMPFLVSATVTLYNAAKARENLQRRYGNRDFKTLKYCVGDWCVSVMQRTFSLKDVRLVGH